MMTTHARHRSLAPMVLAAPKRRATAIMVPKPVERTASLPMMYAGATAMRMQNVVNLPRPPARNALLKFVAANSASAG